jgi:hypothetical protein
MFQLKDLAERLPPGVYDPESMRPAYLPNGLEPNGLRYPDTHGERHSRSDSSSSSYLASTTGIDSLLINGTQGPTPSPRDLPGTDETNIYHQNRVLMTSNGTDENPDIRLPNGGGGGQQFGSSVSEAVDGKESGPFQDSENGMKSRNSALPVNSNQVEAEWIEQYEPGVYITLGALRDGTRDLKRVRFRYLSLLFRIDFFKCKKNKVISDLVLLAKVL